jgi:DNA mismatch repair protein MutL
LKDGYKDAQGCLEVVKDNASSMSKEYAKLSVLSHAISKISTASDIESVLTLGFRGEALRFIASVCAFSLTTSTGQGAGTKVVADGGGQATASPASRLKGTTLLVDRLFYNVPARRAFLNMHSRAGSVTGNGVVYGSLEAG